MKEVKAYIRKNMLNQLTDAFARFPELPGFAFSEVGGFGHDVKTGQLREISMLKIEIDVPDEKVETVITIIQENTKTGEGHFGDGRIYVSDLSKAVRIRDGVRGEEALR